MFTPPYLCYKMHICPFTADPVKALHSAILVWPTILIFWHSGALALRIERQSARMSEIKNGGLDQYGAEPFEQHQFGTAGVKGANTEHVFIWSSRGLHFWMGRQLPQASHRTASAQHKINKSAVKNLRVVGRTAWRKVTYSSASVTLYPWRVLLEARRNTITPAVTVNVAASTTSKTPGMAWEGRKPQKTSSTTSKDTSIPS